MEYVQNVALMFHIKVGTGLISIVTMRLRIVTCVGTAGKKNLEKYALFVVAHFLMKK